MEADAYGEQVITEAPQQAKDIISLAQTVAEREGNQIKQKLVLEAQKTLAQLALIKTASQAELEEQKLYADAAILEEESKETFRQAEARLGQRLSDKAAEEGMLNSQPAPESVLTKLEGQRRLRHCLHFCIWGTWTKVVIAIRKPFFVRQEG